MRIAQAALFVICAALLSAGFLKLTPFPFIWGFVVWSFALAVITAAKLVPESLRIIAGNLCVFSLGLFLLESVFWIWPGLAKVTDPEVRFEGSYDDTYFQRNLPHLGAGPYPSVTAHSRKFIENKEVYDVRYTIDANGLRKSPPPLRSDAEALVFFGGSYTFGEGVHDHEAMPWRVAERCDRRYAVYNFGFHGYGPHQMLSSLENGIVARVLGDIRPRIFVYQGLPSHTVRASGVASWVKSGPRYTLTTETGEVEYSGSFDDAEFSKQPSPVQAWFSRQMWKSSIGRRIPWRKRKYYQSHVDLMVGIVAASRNIILDRWPKAHFHVLFWDRKTCESRALIEGFKERGISVHFVSSTFPVDGSPYRIPLDNHPNAKAHDLLAEYVVREMVGRKESREERNGGKGENGLVNGLMEVDKHWQEVGAYGEHALKRVEEERGRGQCFRSVCDILTGMVERANSHVCLVRDK